MQKSAWKNIIPSLIYDFLKFWILPVNIVNAQIENSQRYIHWNLKFGMYLPCVAFDKFDAAILKIFLFGQLMAQIKKWRPYWIFGHKMTKKQNFQNRYIEFVKCMFAVQMNVLLWIFSIAIYRFCSYCIYRKIRIFKKA